MTRSRQTGITLLETLLAITLLAIMMAMLYSGMHLGIKSVDDGEARMGEIDKIRITHQFLRTQLSRAATVVWGEEDDQPVVFEGAPDHVRFAGPMPGYLGRGGPHLQSVEIVDGEGGQQVIFQYQLLDQEAAEELGTRDDRPPVVLLEGVDEAGFRYMGLEDDGETPYWTDDWDRPAEVPLLVELDIEFVDGRSVPWPVLVAAPLIDPVAGQLAGAPGVDFGPAPGPNE